MWPDDDEARAADAVIVLAGGKHRLADGLALVRRGLAPVLVISDGNDPRWRDAHRLCGQRRPFRVICFHADPYSTQGEARWAADQARRRNWRSLVVVTSVYHVRRSRMLFRRCFEGPLAVVGAEPPLQSFLVGAVLEWPKLAYALTIGRGC